MDKIYHRVVLSGDTATAPDEPAGILGSPGTLNFGRAGNNGIHVLQMELAEDWQGLVIKAAFRTPTGCRPALMDENKEIAVPPSVTAQPTSALLGLISFDGMDAEGRARAGNLLYYVKDAGCPVSPTPPDPDVWQMLVQMFISLLPKQATAETLGTVKAKPVPAQGDRTPVEILPDGTLLAQAGGSDSYNDLLDKPRINGNELIDNKTWQQLGFPDVQALADAAAQSAREAQAAAGSVESAANAAAASATGAQSSASTTTEKAGEASASAQAAAQSASAAEQSKTAAAQSASNADQSAQQASGSASAAAGDADRAEAAAEKIPDPTGVPDSYLASNAEGTAYRLIPTSEIVQEVLAALPNGDEVSY